MSDWRQLLITLAIAIIGSYIGVKMKMPAGGMIGAVFSVGIYQLVTGNGWFPTEVKVMTSAITGTYLGAKVTRDDLKSLLKIPAAAVTMMIGMFGYNFLCCYVLKHFGKMDAATALLATAPAGLTEMSLVALDIGANSAMVSSIQLMRLVSVVSAAPMMMRFILSKWKSGNSEINENTKKQNISKRKKSLATTLAIGLAGGIIGKISGFPAGTMSLAMIVVVIYNIRTGEAYMPIKVRRVAQCFNGAIIGTQLMLADLLLLKMIFPIVAVLTLGWLAVNLILGWILHKFGKLTPETALFATAPGGMSDMGLIAAEMGGNAVQVSVLQMCRVICVIALSPAIAKMIY